MSFPTAAVASLASGLPRTLRAGGSLRRDSRFLFRGGLRPVAGLPSVSMSVSLSWDTKIRCLTPPT